MGKKKASGIILTLLFLSMLTLTLSVQLVKTKDILSKDVSSTRDDDPIELGVGGDWHVDEYMNIASSLSNLVSENEASILSKVSEQSSPSIRVLNPLTYDGNFTFYTAPSPIGTRFNASIWVFNVTDLYAYQIQLTANDTLLNITRAWNPTWDPSWVFYQKTTMLPSPIFFDNDLDGAYEAAIIGDALLSGLTFNGTGLLAVIEFEIIYAPSNGSVSSILDIDNVDTYLLDSMISAISAPKINGFYEYTFVTGVHDVAVTNVAFSKTAIGQGYPMSINVTVENQGDFTETFNITVYSNTTAIGTQEINNIPNGTSTILTFTWNTTGFIKGNYTVRAEADIVPGETDTADNTFTNGWVIVAMIGDITGDDGWPDGKVDILDVATVAILFGVNYPDPLYNPNYDMDGDLKIDILDIATVAIHFGEIDT